ncbi:hypothetical protein LOK49_LG11G00462 [Camellia lanceoleosa]|uniref:Uncharacterized protein n=1 Tax=Camellia lanceoleosa TaxID=1840588 RepID=A0ACC0FZT4_9ERIC|nr:hypothetical protein LOK49_LG11G00462 [Camellia lanceoleosa]
MPRKKSEGMEENMLKPRKRFWSELNPARLGSLPPRLLDVRSSFCKAVRWLSCPAAEMVDGSKVLYYEQAFWRTPHKPFCQRFFMVKPCPKEMKCDVELSTYAIRDAEEYKNYCDCPKDPATSQEEVIGAEKPRTKMGNLHFLEKSVGKWKKKLARLE